MFANNNYFNGQGTFYGNGFAPGQQQYMAARKPKFTNPLTEEDKKSLKNQGGFSLIVSDKDMKKAICTHKDGDQISLRENSDGTVTCWICGETFSLVDLQESGVENITKEFIDVLQSIKTYYLDIPDGVVREFFQMIPFIQKTPEIFKIATNNFQSYENPMTTPMNQSYQMFGMYDAISNPAYSFNPGYGGFGQPAPMQGYNAPMGAVPQYAMGQQMPQNTQPVGQFGYVDNAAPAPAAPQAAPVTPIPQPTGAAPTEAVQTTKTFAL